MELSLEQLTEQLKLHRTNVKDMKLKSVMGEVLEKELEAMKAIQERLKLFTKPEEEAKSRRAAVKTPKGTVDYTPADMVIRDQIFSTIIQTYRKHGAVTIDTPVFELREILQGQYGEDSKLIYDLHDQGGELCSLRYDLTVPFARYLAMHTDCKTPLKRYHIAKVYRRDQPAMTKGRMREFYQCDYDIAGQYESMVPDAEVLKVMCDVLRALEVGNFAIKVNHREILDGIFEVCGVPADKFRSICSAVDKLDKSPWSEVRREMTEEKGLEVSVADRIGKFVKLKGSTALIDELLSTSELSTNAHGKSGLGELKRLFHFLTIYNIIQFVTFDLSLARGLNYYTGVIYEATMVDDSASGCDTSGVGSIAGGGRYDNLVGMFAQNKNSQIPCVGFSIGVERIFSILKQKHAKMTQKLRQVATEVFVVSIDGLLEEHMSICNQLWEAGIKADFMYKSKPKLIKQFEHCDKEENQIPWAVIVGSDEIAKGQVRIKDMRNKATDANEKMGALVERCNLVKELSQRLSTFVQS